MMLKIKVMVTGSDGEEQLSDYGPRLCVTLAWPREASPQPLGEEERQSKEEMSRKEEEIKRVTEKEM